MNKEQTLQAFFDSFGWDAYDENLVPPDATLPYITYEVQTGNFDTPIYLSASLWDRSTSWRSVTEKGIEIARALSYGGVTIPYEDGLLFITQGTPFTQRLADDTDNIRRLMLNFAVEFISAD